MTFVLPRRDKNTKSLDFGKSVRHAVISNVIISSKIIHTFKLRKNVIKIIPKKDTKREKGSIGQER